MSQTLHVRGAGRPVQPYELSATEAVQAIRTGRLTAQALTAAYLDRIDLFDAGLHAWVHVDRAAALQQAIHVDRQVRSGGDPGPLAGVPVGVKDIFNTRDLPTQMGSPIWKGFTPGNDARTVFHLREAGAVILGKTATAEFAVHAPGSTVNPHRVGYAPGTSSSGSAVAVAAGMAPVALGTQTAGSIIRPASYCGVYGYKPSFGCLPRTGTLKTTDSLDTIGFFARSPLDLRPVFDVLRVHGPNHPLSHGALSDAARQVKGTRPWRVAFVEHPKWALTSGPSKRHLADFATKLSASGGTEVLYPALPASLALAHDVHATIYDKTLAYYFKDEFKQKTLISPIMYDIISRGTQISLDDYKRALAAQHQIATDLDDWIQDYDVVLTLSTAGQAPKGLQAEDVPDSCLIWTLCHVPAISVPAFAGPDELPVGMQVIGRRYNDYLLLSFIEWLRARGQVPAGPNPEPDLSQHVPRGRGA